MSSSSKRAVFLDRDGVICYDVHYMSSPDQFRLMPGVGEGIRKLNEAGLPEEDCDCRKPKPGMILEAAKKHNIELSSSYMIGDKQIDADAGKAAGCKTILITEDPSLKADYKVKGFKEAVEIIMSETSDEGVH